MRVVSLVPSATEIIAALGLAGQTRWALARVQLPARGAATSRSSRRRASTRPSIASARDRPRRARRARGRPAAVRGRRRAAREARARPDRDPGSVRGLRRAERRREARRRTSTSRRSRSIRATSARSRIRSARSRGTSAPPGRGELLAQAMHHRIDDVHQLVRGLPRPARVRRRVARPAVRGRALGARDGGPRRRRRGARAAARALVRRPPGRRCGKLHRS